MFIGHLDLFLKNFFSNICPFLYCIICLFLKNFWEFFSLRICSSVYMYCKICIFSTLWPTFSFYGCHLIKMFLISFIVNIFVCVLLFLKSLLFARLEGIPYVFSKSIIILPFTFSSAPSTWDWFLHGKHRD